MDFKLIKTFFQNSNGPSPVYYSYGYDTPNLNTPPGIPSAEWQQMQQRQQQQQQQQFQPPSPVGYYGNQANPQRRPTERIRRCEPLRPCSKYIIVENHTNSIIYAKCSSDPNSMKLKDVGANANVQGGMGGGGAGAGFNVARDNKIQTVTKVPIAPRGQLDWRVQLDLHTSSTYLTIGRTDAQGKLVCSVVDVQIQSGYCYAFDDTLANMEVPDGL